MSSVAFFILEFISVGQPLWSLLLQLSSRFPHVRQHLKDKSKQCLAPWAIPLRKKVSQPSFKRLPASPSAVDSHLIDFRLVDEAIAQSTAMVVSWLFLPLTFLANSGISATNPFY